MDFFEEMEAELELKKYYAFHYDDMIRKSPKTRIEHDNVLLLLLLLVIRTAAIELKNWMLLLKLNNKSVHYNDACIEYLN